MLPISRRFSAPEPIGKVRSHMRSSEVRACCLLLLAPSCVLACWLEAGQRYGVSPNLLYAIASVESNLDALAINLTHRHRTGSYDIGLMQINSSHLPVLGLHGIRELDLYDPCTNIHVGAWLLARAFRETGYGWQSVGAYNAACTRLKGEACDKARGRYAWRVYRRLQATGPEAAPLTWSSTARQNNTSAARGSS